MVDNSFPVCVISRPAMCSGVKTWVTCWCYSTNGCVRFVSKLSIARHPSLHVWAEKVNQMENYILFSPKFYLRYIYFVQNWIGVQGRNFESQFLEGAALWC